MEFQKKVMVFGAHAADFCARSGGTIIKHAKAGDKVLVVDVTFGEKEESGGLWTARPDITVDEVKRIRKEEAEQASSILGADINFLDFGDGPLKIDDSRLQIITEKIAEFKPDLILTHWKNEFGNRAHSVVSEAVVKASYLALSTNKIFFFEPTVGTALVSGFIPDIYVDITDVFEDKIRALEVVKTQPILLDIYKTYAVYRGYEAGCKYAEAFRRLIPLSLVVATL